MFPVSSLFPSYLPSLPSPDSRLISRGSFLWSFLFLLRFFCGRKTIASFLSASCLWLSFGVSLNPYTSSIKGSVRLGLLQGFSVWLLKNFAIKRVKYKMRWCSSIRLRVLDSLWSTCLQMCGLGAIPLVTANRPTHTVGARFVLLKRGFFQRSRPSFPFFVILCCLFLTLAQSSAHQNVSHSPFPLISPSYPCLGKMHRPSFSWVK